MSATSLIVKYFWLAFLFFALCVALKSIAIFFNMKQDVDVWMCRSEEVRLEVYFVFSCSVDFELKYKFPSGLSKASG